MTDVSTKYSQDVLDTFTLCLTSLKDEGVLDDDLVPEVFAALTRGIYLVMRTAIDMSDEGIDQFFDTMRENIKHAEKTNEISDEVFDMLVDRSMARARDTISMNAVSASIERVFLGQELN